MKTWEQERDQLHAKIEQIEWAHLYETYRHGTPVDADDWRHTDRGRMARAEDTTVPGFRMQVGP